MRPWVVVLHRWAGLLTAVFLLVAGATGCIIAFEDELEAWLNPDLFVVAARLDAAGRELPMLDPFELRERAAEALPGYRISNVRLRPQPYRSVLFFLHTDQGGKGHIDQAFVDPYTGVLLGTREYGATLFARATLIGFIYRLHYTLALPGPWGKWLFGVIAIIWTLDCFLGAWLTLPRGRPFWSKWGTAWKIKRNASFIRLNLDLHRAFGLWLWLILLVYAWSSVMLNLRQEFYRPVMSSLFRFSAPLDAKPLPKPLDEPALSWREALLVGRRAMSELAVQKQFVVHYEDALTYNRAAGFYAYTANTSRDIVRDRGQTSVYFDANTGATLGARIQTGEAPGDTISRWLQSLHMAQIWGLPYQIFVSLLGLVVAMLSVTGVVVWWHKRAARRSRIAAQAAPVVQGEPVRTFT